MGWSNAVITNGGLGLIAKAVSGGTLTITDAALGGGTVDTTALMVQTELTNPLTVPAVIAAKGTLENGISVRVQIRNTGVTVTQHMKQVGLFAKIDTDDPVLFAIMQNDTGEEIPPASEYPDFMIEFTAAIAVSNTDNIVVTISTSAVITRDTLDEELKNYPTKTEMTNALKEKANTTDVEEALKGKSDTNHTHNVSDIKDFPEALPANGGNADTVGNKSVAQIMALGMNVSDRTRITEGDLNDYTSPGQYTVVTSTQAAAISNSPFSDSGYYLDVYYRATGYYVQIAMTWNGRIKIRSCMNSTWGEWKNISDDGNADTVDGKHASELVQWLGKITSVDIVNDPNYAVAYECNLAPAAAVEIGLTSAWYHLKYFRHEDSGDVGWGLQIALPLTASADSPRYRFGANSSTSWGTWHNFADGGAAATADSAGTQSATASNICLRNLSSGTAAATSSNCPVGSWYGQHS